MMSAARSRLEQASHCLLWSLTGRSTGLDGAPTVVFLAILLAGIAALASLVVGVGAALSYTYAAYTVPDILDYSRCGDVINVSAAVFTGSCWLARAHWQGKPLALPVQVLVSLLCVCAYPLLFVIHGLLIAFLLRSDARRWYSGKPL